MPTCVLPCAHIRTKRACTVCVKICTRCAHMLAAGALSRLLHHLPFLSRLRRSAQVTMVVNSCALGCAQVCSRVVCALYRLFVRYTVGDETLVGAHQPCEGGAPSTGVHHLNPHLHLLPHLPLLLLLLLLLLLHLLLGATLTLHLHLAQVEIPNRSRSGAKQLKLSEALKHI